MAEACATRRLENVTVKLDGTRKAIARMSFLVSGKSRTQICRVNARVVLNLPAMAKGLAPSRPHRLHMHAAAMRISRETLARSAHMVASAGPLVIRSALNTMATCAMGMGLAHRRKGAVSARLGGQVGNAKNVPKIFGDPSVGLAHRVAAAKHAMGLGLAPGVSIKAALAHAIRSMETTILIVTLHARHVRRTFMVPPASLVPWETA